MTNRKAICVFAGSSTGVEPSFGRAAADLGRELVARGYGIVYGGASVGLMGIMADAALGCGGHVTGVIPDFLVQKEIVHIGLSELKIVSSMHERKAVMASLSGGFVALPGGFGTIEEFFEVLTWGQLGLHGKPCGLLDVGGYFDGILRFLDAAVDHGLLTPEHRSMVLVDGNPGTLVDKIERYTPPIVAKWWGTALT